MRSIIFLAIIIAIPWIIIFIYSPKKGNFLIDSALKQLQQQVNKQINKNKIQVYSYGIPLQFESNMFVLKNLTNKSVIQQTSIILSQQNSSSTIQLMTQISKSQVIFNKNIYITFLIHKSYHSFENSTIELITIYLKQLGIPSYSISIIVKYLIGFQFQKNIYNKLQNIQYIQQIMEEFIDFRDMSICKLTWQKCQNYLIYPMNSLKQTQYYYMNNIYITPNITQPKLKEILFQILDIRPIYQLYKSKFNTRQQIKLIWHRYQYLQFLRNTIAELKYLQFINLKSYYNHTLEEKNIIQKWINNVHKKIIIYNSGNYSLLWDPSTVSIISNDKIGILDLFPTDYTIGVYIPILVLAFYPLIGFTKMIMTAIKQYYKIRK